MAKKGKGKGHPQNLEKDEDQILQKVLAMSLHEHKSTKGKLHYKCITYY